MERRTQPTVPSLLIDQIDKPLTAVDDARTELGCGVAARAPLRDRREAHARVHTRVREAHALLRQAVAIAKQRSYWDWSLRRQRLSSLDTTRQVHLLAEQDEAGPRPVGSVHAIDTGSRAASSRQAA